MASIFGHSAVSFTLARIIDNKNLKYLLIAAIFSSILPDFDVVAFPRLWRQSVTSLKTMLRVVRGGHTAQCLLLPLTSHL